VDSFTDAQGNNQDNEEDGFFIMANCFKFWSGTFHSNAITE